MLRLNFFLFQYRSNGYSKFGQNRFYCHFSFSDMEWPKFDFAKRSLIRSQQLSDVGKANLKRSRRKVYRSLVANLDIKSRKKGNSTKENITILHQQVLPNSLICSQVNPFQLKTNTEKVPPLSPILVNGFLKNPTACSATCLKRSSSHLEETFTSLKCTGSLAIGTSHYTNPIALESIVIPLDSKQSLLSSESPTSFLQGSKATQESRTFGNQSQITASFITIEEESNHLKSKCRNNSKKANQSPNLHGSPSTAASTGLHSLEGFLTSLETLPPSQIHCKNLNNESFPKLDFISSQLSSESDESIMIQDTRSDSDVFQTYTVCVDDSESFTTRSEQSRDFFLDVTIHEIEPNDLQNTSSLVTNQLKIYDLQEESSETTQYQRQYHRLSKLAEILKKRLFISSSDLVMWKCEEPKQHPIRKVTLISSVEQWGFCCTLVKNVGNLGTAHLMDSEPMKKIVDAISRNKSEKARNPSDDEEDPRCHDSSPEETFFLYQPLSKLNTSSGEFILSPRYYR